MADKKTASTNQAPPPKKIAPFDKEFAQALNFTLSEWHSANDEEDFKDLIN